MLIGVDGSRAFLGARTGTENYSYELLKNLALLDTENSYLIYLRKGQRSRIKPQEWPTGFKFVEINFPRLWTQIGLALKTFSDPLDMLFIPSHTLPLIRRPGLKTVITVHDLGAEFLPGSHQLKQVLYLKLMTDIQLKTATKIIAVSKATKKDIIERVGVSYKKIDFIYEGVDRSIFKKISKDALNNILNKYNLKPQSYFLFVGTIQPRKNLQRLINAFAEYLKTEDSKMGLKLVLVGGKGWKSEGIYTLPKELGINDKVEFLGRIPDPDLVGLYNGASALTYPSLFEGFGLPIIEAFACECPVITSNTSSMPEVAGNAAIIVDPKHQARITEAMLKISKDDIFRSSLINKGTVRLSLFDWKVAAKKTIDIFNKLHT